jgi:predicted nucleic acid-binding protein
MLVVDASVVAKWVIPEPDGDLARALRTDTRTFAAPSLVVEEVGNIVWKHVRRGEIPKDKALAVARTALGLIHLITPGQELHESAIDLDHPIYDCFYLALAVRERASLATADARLAALGGQADVTVEFLAAGGREIRLPR